MTTNANTFDTEIYIDPQDPTGRKYLVEFIYDTNSNGPLEDSDGHGVTEELMFHPTDMDKDDLRHELGLDEDDDSPHAMEQMIQYSLMLPLTEGAHARHHARWELYYDVWSSLKKAKAENWCSIDHDNDPEANDKLHAAVMQDYDYLRGWYTDKWHYCGIKVTPYQTEAELLSSNGGDEDAELELLEDYDESLWGIEYGAAPRDREREYHEEVIRDLVHQCQWAMRKADEKAAEAAGQRTLDLTS